MCGPLTLQRWRNNSGSANEAPPDCALAPTDARRRCDSEYAHSGELSPGPLIEPEERSAETHQPGGGPWHGRGAAGPAERSVPLCWLSPARHRTGWRATGTIVRHLAANCKYWCEVFHSRARILHRSAGILPAMSSPCREPLCFLQGLLSPGLPPGRSRMSYFPRRSLAIGPSRVGILWPRRPGPGNDSTWSPDSRPLHVAGVSA